MKPRICSIPQEGELPYSHLQPIVSLLLANGAQFTLEHGWYQNRDGWRCDLSTPIPFDLVRERFDFPKSISLGEEHDCILCRKTWIVIQGSGAAKRPNQSLQRNAGSRPFSSESPASITSSSLGPRG
jgi:hypothetical protein